MSDPSMLQGTFLITLTPAAYDGGVPVAGMTGKVKVGPEPKVSTTVLVAKDGACTLWKKVSAPFCDPDCPDKSTPVCDDDLVCQPYPMATQVGSVEVKGLRDASGPITFEMLLNESSYGGASYNAPGTFAYPPFADGDPVTLKASGCAYPAFTLTSHGIEPLVLKTENVPLEDGKPIELAWTPPADPSTTAIHVRVDISHHGGLKGEILCDPPDNGSLTISAALVSGLYKLGIAGFPSVQIARSAVGGVASGHVELAVESPMETGIDIPGLHSCTQDGEPLDPDPECDGRRCRADLTCECGGDADCPAGKKCEVCGTHKEDGSPDQCCR